MLFHLVALLALAKSVWPNVFPGPGNCQHDGQVFDCSRQDLSKVPMLPSEVVQVVLSDNQIKAVESNLPSSVTELDLSNNLLRTLALSSTELFSLKVSGNPLMQLNLNLDNLRILNASSCFLSYLPQGFSEGLPRLEVLDLSGNGKLRALPSPLPSLLVELHAQRITQVRNLPQMPIKLVLLDVSNNIQLLNLQTGESLKTLKAANCSLIGVLLNTGLLHADLSSNQISALKIYKNLEFLDASNNSVGTLDIESDARLHTVNLADNKLTDLRVTSRFLSRINLSKNPIIDLSVHCSQCAVECASCRVQKVDLMNVKSINLERNNIERITIDGGAKEVDLRHNLLTEVTLTGSSIETFDLRNNSLTDPAKVTIQGMGYLADNPWACKCEGLRALREKSIDEQLLCGDHPFETCFTGPRKTSHSAWVTLVVALFLLAAFMLVLYLIRLTSKDPVSQPPQDASECEQVYRNDALPTYEEALRMSKPEWRQARNSARRCRPD